jgi:hypothetical protein
VTRARDARRLAMLQGRERDRPRERREDSLTAPQRRAFAACVPRGVDACASGRSRWLGGSRHRTRLGARRWSGSSTWLCSLLAVLRRCVAPPRRARGGTGVRRVCRRRLGSGAGGCARASVDRCFGDWNRDSTRARPCLARAHLAAERLARVVRGGHAAHLTGLIAIGSVFFFYCPFGGGRLERVLDDLEGIARTRQIRVCCVDLPLPSRPWLTLASPPFGDLGVYRSTLLDPRAD